MSIPAPDPPSEERRLAALYEYELLDTPSEALFDAFTRLAALLCDAPISLISLGVIGAPEQTTTPRRPQRRRH